MKKVVTISALFFLFNFTWASIQYTSVNEYAYPAARFYDIDLDGDNDFSFSSSNNDYLVEGLKASCFYSAEGASGSKPKGYQQGAAMGTYHWYNGIGSLIQNGGNFNSVERYLMIKFNDTNNNTYYGWVLLSSFNGGGSLFILGYAYQDVPNQTIRAGELEATGINDIKASNFYLFPNPASTQLFIETNGTEVEQVNVYSTTGSLVSQSKLPQSKSIDVSELAQGVYIAEIKTKEASVKRRWVKM